MNMKQKTGKLLMAAIAAVLLFTSACGESQEETPPKTPENTLSNGAARRNRKRKAMGPIRKRMIRRRCLNSG